ncbi:MAG TPA: hypothetical protein VIT92_02030 [Burkholderiaceae bacterium]
MSERLPVSTEMAVFLRQGLSITLATRDGANLPSLLRVIGCRVEADGDLTVFFPGERAGEMLANVADNGLVAGVFSNMKSHETLQIKGRGAHRVDVIDDDFDLITRYGELFVAALKSIGHGHPGIKRIIAFDPAKLVALRFQPTAVFIQTPGPQAGAVLAESP